MIGTPAKYLMPECPGERGDLKMDYVITRFRQPI
jgi:hypothetical protein